MAKEEFEALKPQLHLLLSHFAVDYHLTDLKNSAEEMELFSLVTEVCFSILKKKEGKKKKEIIKKNL